jgi:hypothetical protein
MSDSSSMVQSRSAAERRAMRRKQKILASAGNRMKVVSGEMGTSSTEARNSAGTTELDPELMKRTTSVMKKDASLSLEMDSKPTMHRSITQALDLPAGDAKENSAEKIELLSSPQPIAQTSDMPCDDESEFAMEKLLDSAISDTLNNDHENTESTSPKISTLMDAPHEINVNNIESETCLAKEPSKAVESENLAVGVVRRRKRPARRKLDTEEVEKVMAEPSPTLIEHKPGSVETYNEVTGNSNNSKIAGGPSGAQKLGGEHGVVATKRKNKWKLAAKLLTSTLRLLLSKEFQLCMIPVWLGLIFAVAFLCADSEAARQPGERVIPAHLLPPMPPCGPPISEFTGADASRSMLEEYLGVALGDHNNDEYDGESNLPGKLLNGEMNDRMLHHPLPLFVLHMTTFMLSVPMHLALIAAHAGVHAPYRLISRQFKSEPHSKGGIMAIFKVVMDTYRYAGVLFDDFCILVFITFTAVLCGRIVMNGHSRIDLFTSNLCHDTASAV